MKLAKLVHNPGAGEKRLSKKELTAFIKAKGWDCRYSSTKGKDFSAIHPKTDFIIVAGGDGTVRKASAQIFERKLIEKRLPIALLPTGTANNIARTLGIEGELSFLIESWYNQQVKAFDIGKIEGLTGYSFFLEALGAGVFPKLIREMESADPLLTQTPEQEIELALQKLHEIILAYEAKQARIQVDEQTYSGNFLIVEIMNIQSIGPNLLLSDGSDPGDGELELMLVYEEDRQKLADYVLAIINGKSPAFPFNAIKGKKFELEWGNSYLHVDDVVTKTEKRTPVKIQPNPRVLEFLIPGPLLKQ